jgi:hypothetical protein
MQVLFQQLNNQSLILERMQLQGVGHNSMYTRTFYFHTSDWWDSLGPCHGC